MSVSMRPASAACCRTATRCAVPFSSHVAGSPVLVARAPRHLAQAPQLPGRSPSWTVRAGQGEEKPVVYNKEFGYSRKDIILIGVGLTAFGYALYYGLQATGMEPGFAGNWVQLIIFMGICVGWVSTYVYRVATKQMTYVKQLEQYEEAVMRKRLDEMTEEEMTDLVSEAEKDKSKKPSK